jgi:hypothetical protein
MWRATLSWARQPEHTLAAATWPQRRQCSLLIISCIRDHLLPESYV